MRFRLVYRHILAAALLAISALLAEPALASCPQPQFAPPIVHSGPGFFLATQGISSGDFNNDGLSDLLVSDSTGASVFLADGSGHFLNQFSSGTANGPHAAAALDVNHDGNLDFAMIFSSNVITHDGTTLILHFGDGSGNFTSPLALYQEVGPMEEPRAMVAGDFNGDGTMDLAISTRDGLTNNRLTYGLGDGQGHFVMNHASTQFAADVDDPVALGAGDLDGDGMDDLVVHSVHPTASTTQQDVFVSYGSSLTGASGIVRRLRLGEAPAFEWVHTQSNSVVVADLNSDGKLDFAVQDRSAGAVLISLGAGTRQPGALASYPVSGVAVAAGDLNGDGKLDLATADPASAHACVLLGDGAGGFGAATCFPSAGYSTSIAVDRFNNADGSFDLAVANMNESKAAILLNTCAGPPIDIRATSVEVTQIVQDLANSVRLVAGKRTFARVHLAANYDRLAVSATLQPMDANGAPLGPELLPGNLGAVAFARVNPDRGELDDAFYFELPSTLTKVGSIKLKAVINPLHTITESDYTNNTITSSVVTFQQAAPMKLRVVDYSYKGTNGDVTNDPEDIAKFVDQIKNMFPIDQISVTQVSVYDPAPPAIILDGTEQVPQDGNALIAWLKNYRATKEPQNEGTLYYLLIHGFHGLAEDIPSLNAIGQGIDAAHEVGHMLGRKHVKCTGREEGTDDFYPYDGGKIGGPANDPTHYYGLSAAADRPFVVPPTTGDLMGYCEPRWLSSYTLDGIWAYRAAHPGLAPGLRRMQAGASVSGDFLAIFGQIDQSTEDVSLTGVSRVATVGEIPPLIAGPYHLRLLDDHGATLADHAFSATFTSEGGSDAVFGQVVDFEAGTRTVEIYSDTSHRVLTTVPVSENPPTVTITTQLAGANIGALDAISLEWTSGDLDFDALHYDVYYSPDGGSTWQLLVTGLSQESVVIQSSRLKGTGGAEAGYLRVVASDGVLTGSDQTGPMTVDDKAPFVTVLHPSSTNFFRFGQTVTLEGWGLDLEDGTLGDSHFAWNSNRSGPLGTGRLLHLTDLPSGTHTITLGVTDEDGQMSFSAVVITVGPEAETNSAPAFTSVSEATTAKEGDAVVLSASATDPDAGQSILVTASGYPADLLLTPGSAVMPASAQATITGMLGYSDGDQNPTKYTIQWNATDGTLAATAVTELSVMDVVPIEFVLTPGTLNLRSMGRWVTGYLEPPSPYSAVDILAASATLNGSIVMDGAAPTEIGDQDGDGNPDLMVKFDRSALELNVDPGDNVKVTVTGTMAGHYFIGTDYIRVIRAVVTKPAAGTHLDPGSATTIAWTTPAGVNIQSVALLSSMDGGTTWNLEASGLPNVGSYPWTVPDASTYRARVAVVLVEDADETGYLVDGVVGMSGLFSIGNVTAVEGGAAPELVLKVVRPNPTQEALRVTFGLPDARPAKVEVFNVSGRRVAARDVGDMGPGFHTVTMDDRRALPSGVYLVRLTQAGKKVTTRAVLVR